MSPDVQRMIIASVAIKGVFRQFAALSDEEKTEVKSKVKEKLNGKGEGDAPEEKPEESSNEESSKVTQEEDWSGEWNPESDSIGGNGDTPTEETPEETPEDTEETSEEGDGEDEEEKPGLLKIIDDLSSEVEQIKSDGKVDSAEVIGLFDNMVQMVNTLIQVKAPGKPKAVEAKVFSTKKEMEGYLRKQKNPDPSKHSVKPNNEKKPKKDDKPNGKSKKKDEKGEKGKPDDSGAGVQVNKETVETFRREIPEYNLEIIAGKDGVLDKAEIENAKDIKSKVEWLAKRIEEGAKEAADVCKMKPPVCEGNMGITRDNMPQVMDKSIKELLNSSDEKDRAKGQASVDAGGDPEDERPVMQQLFEQLQKSEGISITKEKIPVGQLKATQREIKADKTFGMANAFLEGNEGLHKAMGNPIIVSQDNHILDGHHRYSAMLTADPSYEMKVVKVGMDMKDFLSRSHEQPGVFRADINDNIIPKGQKLDIGGGKSEKKARMVDRVASDFLGKFSSEEAIANRIAKSYS